MTDPSEWVKLDNFKCPAAGCPNQEAYSWTCTDHRSPMYINALGKLRCEEDCYADICQQSWKCPHSFHGGGHNTKADLQSMTFALAQNTDLMSKAGAKWTGALIVELGKQYGC